MSNPLAVAVGIWHGEAEAPVSSQKLRRIVQTMPKGSHHQLPQSSHRILGSSPVDAGSINAPVTRELPQ